MSRRTSLYRRLARDVAAARLPVGPVDPCPVTESDLAGLPGTVQRYMRAMGVVGRPRDWSLRAHVTGRFRLRPGGRAWPCEAWQYNYSLEVTRIFHMRARIARVVPLLARDVYLKGEGGLHAKLLGRFTVAEGEGPEYDVGELVTYLNDAVLFAPSMLLGVATFAPVDHDSFHVTLTDRGQTVRGRVFLDDHGLPRNFSTRDRYCDLPDGLVQVRWSTPVERWHVVHGRPQPSRARAVWQLPEGPFTYAEFQFPEVTHNVSTADYRRIGVSARE